MGEINAITVAAQGEQLKTVFKNMDALNQENKDMFEKISENKREITRLKTKFSGLTILISEQNKTQTLEIHRLFEETLSANNQEIADKEIKILLNQIEKKDRYQFWMFTSFVGTIMTYIIISWLNSRII